MEWKAFNALKPITRGCSLRCQERWKGEREEETRREMLASRIARRKILVIFHMTSKRFSYVYVKERERQRIYVARARHAPISTYIHACLMLLSHEEHEPFRVFVVPVFVFHRELFPLFFRVFLNCFPEEWRRSLLSRPHPFPHLSLNTTYSCLPLVEYKRKDYWMKKLRHTFKNFEYSPVSRF